MAESPDFKTVVVDDPTEKRKIYEDYSCPLHVCGKKLLGIKERDESFRRWSDDWGGFIQGFIDGAGLELLIKGGLTRAMCMGDDKDEFYLEYIIKR